MSKRKRRIGIIVGSESDLVQCIEGFDFLQSSVIAGEVEVPFVHVTSIHRNTEKQLADLRKFSGQPSGEKVDVLIIGAGWANHLTCTSDAFLRNALCDDRIVVYGVAFEDPSNPEHTQAAVLSITEVPGRQVVFRDYVGSMGFYWACRDAVSNELPQIKLSQPKQWLELTLPQARARGAELLEEKRKKEGGMR